MVYIVVPIFNTEKYLEQCLKSIHKQTYQNWKCLLVNDGSTDAIVLCGLPVVSLYYKKRLSDESIF